MLRNLDRLGTELRSNTRLLAKPNGIQPIRLFLQNRVGLFNADLGFRQDTLKQVGANEGLLGSIKCTEICLTTSN
jgi:hypothetical protein